MPGQPAGKDSSLKPEIRERTSPRPLRVKPIGVIHTPFREAAGAPIQPKAARGSKGTVHILEEYQEALQDLEGFERIWLLYWFHRALPARLRVVPYLDSRERGLFATRAPCRPNPIGMSPVRLLRVDGNALHVADVDMLDGSPLLDIKPYVPEFDCFEVTRCGWLEKAARRPRPADGRFEQSHPGSSRPPRV